MLLSSVPVLPAGVVKLDHFGKKILHRNISVSIYVCYQFGVVVVLEAAVQPACETVPPVALPLDRGKRLRSEPFVERVDGFAADEGAVFLAVLAFAQCVLVEFGMKRLDDGDYFVRRNTVIHAQGAQLIR